MIKNMFLSASKKSIGALIMIISLILQMVIPVAAADKAEDTAYLNNVALLEKLGIVTEEDAMQYSEETVSRENFAQMLGVFYGFSRSQAESGSGSGMFEDVSVKSTSCAVIEAVSGAGAMDGYKDKRFRPSASLTVEQAAKAMVVLLGYSPVLPKFESDYSAYTEKARKLDILDGIKKSYAKAITKSELVKMFINAFDVEVLHVAGGSYEKEYETVKGETLLSERLGIYKIEGILQATDVTGIANFESTYKNYIIVDGYEIHTQEDMNEQLGMHLNVYCTGDDYQELEMLYFFETEKNEIFTLSAEDITDAKDDIISYEADGKIKKVKLAKNATVIYNGKSNPLYDDDTFKIAEGSIKFIDTDNDGKYETVVIKSYISIWVSQVYNENGKVYLIDEHAKKYLIDTEAPDTTIIFKKDNAVVSYTDIKNKSVVSIAADKIDSLTNEISADATYIEVLISDKSVSGVLEGINHDEEELEINGEKYAMNKAFDLAAYELTLNDSAKFYINVFGKVVAAEKGSANLYAILERVYADESNNHIEGIKLFSSDGAFKTFESAQKITIDSVRYSYTDIAEIQTALKAGSNRFFLLSGMSNKGAGECFQLIKYSTNPDGQIIMIDTLVQNSTNPDIEKNYLNYKDKLQDIDKSGAINYFSKSYATTIEGGYIYDGSIIVFKLPSDKSIKDGYSKKSGLSALGYEKLDIPVHLFDVNEYNYVPVIVAESDSVENVPQKEDTNMMVFEKLTKELNEFGDVCDVMNGTSIKAGTTVKAYMDEEAYEQFAELGIKSGDIVRWSSDDLNTVTSIELLLDNEGNQSGITVGGSTTPGYSTGFYSDFRITCGTVEKFDSKYIMFNLGSSQEASLVNPSAKVLVYNSDTRKTEKGDYSAIKTAEAFGSDASLVFTYQWYTAINTIVIFN